jgi:hypothetical protein
MLTQHKTGTLTERLVSEQLVFSGLIAIKPIPDKGIDFMVHHPDHEDKKVLIQVKGRGATQKNKRYRWFQIRTTPKQRKETVEAGLPVSEAWRKKVKLCDFFILVSERYSECWVFPKDIICEIASINRKKYGGRKDNQDGIQTELDLDIEDNGVKLTKTYSDYLNNFDLVKQATKG